MSRDSSLPPLKVNVVDDPPLRTQIEPFDDRSQYNSEVPIAVDFGACTVKAGFANQSAPSHVFPTVLTRFRDRRLNKTMTFIGNDTALDHAVRMQAKTPFDGSVITNWEYVEDMMEYTFNHLGVVGNYGVSNPLIINERLACLQSQRTHWYQLLFETYQLPKISFGIDNMFAFYGNTHGASSTGLVIGCNHEDTKVIPVVDGKGILTESKRINWGGHHAVNYLGNLLSLKYPYFPSKISDYQYQKMYEDYCYVSRDYDTELSTYLNLENLEQSNVVVEVPFAEAPQQPQKTEEELKLQAEKRKETGKRLQEQAKLKRQERMEQKREELEYYTQLKAQLEEQPKKKVISLLANAGFDDERDFKRYIYNLERSLRKSQSLDEDESTESAPQTFELLEVPDEQLDEEQIKEKRKQRLMKANLDARQKAKEEKERQAKEEEEARLREEEWRKTDLSSWIKDKRSKLNTLIKQRKEKLKMRDEMKDRKSQAFQKRMKNLASLAEDNVRTGSKRNRQQATIDNDPNDTFGANDEDWLVYNDITQNSEAFEELIEEEYKKIVELETQLLEYDPNFTEEDTLDAQYSWKNSTLHLFLRGPRPHDSEDIHQQHQMHLNVERIRVPEVMFQPNMGACDQAGIVELCETILLRKFSSKPSQLSPATLKMAKNIWLTGGNARVPGLKERVVREFTQFLPVGTELNVRISNDPALDAWKGMQTFAQDTSALSQSFISKQDYEEYGPEYIKEHNLGNMKYFE